MNREQNTKELEIWADSFPEGEWFCQQLVTVFNLMEIEYRHGFQPIYTFQIGEDILRAVVYGDYGAWEDVPQKISELLVFGKPDGILYDRNERSILLSIEETNAVPTGNQSLQRLERVWGSANEGIPCVYLLCRYGLHVDGGVRTSSIWPSYVSTKLSCQYRTPSLVLYFGDKSHPEDYDYGTGVAKLTSIMSCIIRRWLGIDYKVEYRESIGESLREMTKSVLDGHEDMLRDLPGKERLADGRFIEDLRDYVFSMEVPNPEGDEVAQRIYEYSKEFEWGDASYELTSEETMYKNDALLTQVIELVNRRKAWSPVKGTTKRTEPRQKIENWIQNQYNHRDSVNNVNRLPVKLSPEDFPEAGNGKVIVTTGSSILYLIDDVQDFLALARVAFPNTTSEIEELLTHRMGVALFVSNSVHSNGRALKGDPFAGQMAAYSTIFSKDLTGSKTRYFVGYYPHQLYTQVFQRNGRPAQAKGIRIIQNLADLVVFSDGVFLNPKNWEVFR